MSDVLVLPAVAKNVLYQCKKCDAERYHRVLAHTSETSAKIECEICGSKKTFKLTKPKSAAKKENHSQCKEKSFKDSGSFYLGGVE